MRSIEEKKRRRAYFRQRAIREAEQMAEMRIPVATRGLVPKPTFMGSVVPGVYGYIANNCLFHIDRADGGRDFFVRIDHPIIPYPTLLYGTRAELAETGMLVDMRTVVLKSTSLPINAHRWPSLIPVIPAL